jgi:hypothetical protein
MFYVLYLSTAEIDGVLFHLLQAEFNIINVGKDSNIIECEGIGLENNGV